MLRHERFQSENKLVQLQERAKNDTTQAIEQYPLAKEKLKQLDLKDLEATKIRANAHETFFNAAIPNLPEDACNSCEGELTEEELRKAVTAMELDKSPGIDGLTTNFYKHF